jgi:hypothetical protein
MPSGVDPSLIGPAAGSALPGRCADASSDTCCLASPIPTHQIYSPRKASDHDANRAQ